MTMLRLAARIHLLRHPSSSLLVAAYHPTTTSNRRGFRSSSASLLTAGQQLHKYNNKSNKNALGGWRLFSVVEPTTATTSGQEEDDKQPQEQEEQEEEQQEPSLTLPETLTMPKALSPSAILEFQNCPQSFLFQYILGHKQPTNEALAKGSMVHAALEQVFDLKPGDRTLHNLQNLLRRQWSLQRNDDKYRDLFANDTAREAVWGKQALRLLQNYVELEDPTTIHPAPLRELWVTAHLATDARLGVTASAEAKQEQQEESERQAADQPFADILQPSRSENAVNGVNYTSFSNGTVLQHNATNETFFVRGIVDRLDLVPDKTTVVDDATPAASNASKRRRGRRPKNNGGIVLRLCDYKTGKAPVLKYSAAMNEKILQENFLQLKIYALLLREQRPPQVGPNLELRHLRLFYLTTTGTASSSSADKKTNPPQDDVEDRAKWLDYDLGATQAERDEQLNAVHQQLAQVWRDIAKLVAANDATLWKGCDRSFCWCHKCRPRFEQGTPLWEPPPSSPSSLRP